MLLVKYSTSTGALTTLSSLLCPHNILETSTNYTNETRKRKNFFITFLLFLFWFISYRWNCAIFFLCVWKKLEELLEFFSEVGTYLAIVIINVSCLIFPADHIFQGIFEVWLTHNKMFGRLGLYITLGFPTMYLYTRSCILSCTFSGYHQNF